MNRHQRRAAKAKGRKQAAGYLERLFASHGDLPETGVCDVFVAHDDWCGALQGTGICTCTPDMHRRVRGSNEVQTIHADGSVTTSKTI